MKVYQICIKSSYWTVGRMTDNIFAKREHAEQWIKNKRKEYSEEVAKNKGMNGPGGCPDYYINEVEVL